MSWTYAGFDLGYDIPCCSSLDLSRVGSFELGGRRLHVDGGDIRYDMMSSMGFGRF